MTIKNIIEMASNPYIRSLLSEIEDNERNKINMTEYEQKQADKRNRKLASQIKDELIIQSLK